MKQVFFKFDFDEKGIDKQKETFNKFLEESMDKGININFAKKFPPCILPSDSQPFSTEELICLNSKTILISNNLYYGQTYEGVNKVFRTSPFISNKCKKCKYNQKFECRGLFNRKFLDKRKELIERLGEENYNAVKSDYEEGTFVHGSFCKSNCRFCFDKTLPLAILRKVPILRTKDIIHFLHYLPKKILYIGNTFHCKSGEITDSPNFSETIDILKYFSRQSPILLTNGRNIDEKLVSILKESKIEVGISFPSLDEGMIKKWSNVTEKMDYIRKINLLRENNIRYHVGLIPLKSLVESRDIFRTIDLLLSNDPNCSIRINPPSGSRYMEDEVRNELTFDCTPLKKELLLKYPDNVWFTDEVDKESNIGMKDLINEAKSKLMKICANKKKYLLLCPDKTFDAFHHFNPNNIKVEKVVSSLGFTKPCAGVLLIEDYKNAIKNQTEKFDTVIIPKNSFGSNFDDFSLININKLWKETSKISSNLILL